MKKEIILLGSGGHAKSVVDAIEASGLYKIAGFVSPAEETAFGYHGYRNIGGDEKLQELFDSGIHDAFVGVGYVGQDKVRNRLYGQLKEIGYNLPVIIDPTAVLARDVCAGEGTFIGKMAVVNANASIGKMTIINTASIIEHDCVIENFCHISVGSILCGGVSIGEGSFVGAGTTVIQGVKIGEGCMIGAGSLVLREVSSQKKIFGII